jgi:hypothetical protein
LLRQSKPLRPRQERFKATQSEVILTQGLCEICALDYNDIVRAAHFPVAAN